jgi:hypothetical protein
MCFSHPACLEHETGEHPERPARFVAGRATRVIAGRAAPISLAGREWAIARGSFDAAPQQEETPEALSGLGIALGWLDEDVVGNQPKSDDTLCTGDRSG